jgi:ParB family chromosome partitioning protein
MLEMSIIENIQRENLNPIEEADAYHRLMTRFNMTQDRVAARVGKSRSAVANLLRLRQLPEPVKSDIVEKTLSMGHARALLGADTPTLLEGAWRIVVSKRLSVRETENLIKRLNKGRRRPQTPPISSDKRYFDGIAEELSRRFGTKVQIKRKGQRGKVEVDFYSDSDLDRVLNLLKGS